MLAFRIPNSGTNSNRWAASLTDGDDSAKSDDFTPLVVVISGPSGVGKDVLIEGMAGRGLDYHFTVTATTRAPRPGEEEGINHHFLSVDEFERAIRDDELLEWARVYGNYYGVPKQQVRDALSQGKHVIIRVDLQGALRIKELAPEALMIFIHPPNMEVLRERLERRGVNSEADIATRLDSAATEIEQSVAFDRQVVNREGKLESAVEEVIEIVYKESHRVPPRMVKI
ncbi:MAG: guanylate kinase [Chloroflexi bacterium]|nr:guanylate kinase [Chloroflexota bacterium]MYF79809.1 guanylate kinase [Chloroflexota bacterium]MYK61376.1 guanylate kinase [Chloroflexota bacterium]